MKRIGLTTWILLGLFGGVLPRVLLAPSVAVKLQWWRRCLSGLSAAGGAIIFRPWWSAWQYAGSAIGRLVCVLVWFWVATAVALVVDLGRPTSCGPLGRSNTRAEV